MKFSSACLLTLLTTATATAQQLLRQQQEESACNQVSSQSACFATTDDATGLPCEWCVAGAIPSECVTQEQASQLPAGVFDCSAPGRVHQQDGIHYVFPEQEPHPLTYHLRQATNGVNGGVGDDICDASSKSLSGYMDIKGSDYDKNGQNKHLFYWMFEKRGDFDENTPFIVRLCIWIHKRLVRISIILNA